MPDLEDFRQSIANMSKQELYEKIRELRRERRKPVDKTKTTSTAGVKKKRKQKASDVLEGLTQEQAQALLHQLSDGK
jgi:hypothetical protein